MPQYKGKQYGQFQYGRYILHGKNGLKVSDAIRLRVIKNALHIQTIKETMPGNPRPLRIRTENGTWAYSASAVIKKETYRIRMRINHGEWIESIRYKMKGE